MKIHSILIIFNIILLSGCTSAYNIFIETKDNTPVSIMSERISKHYSDIGFSVSGKADSTLFTLGQWYSKGHAGIHHAERENRLWIWIMPPPQSDSAIEILHDVQAIIDAEFPEANIRVVESRSPDLR
ncbi:hypothetical protein G0Q06_05605 [Puniceicoccales bacterium CK1056]|uniref:Lipoprotein n=1 Tax=Oceanipulchritudo coccoides TaxID=2706888 RepID=A0A6B2M0S4_9BACT|nr:hypothetical protein [Oceanipulchritudo coccoides]NDV61919.1 hypothetical protein [Oceanipulchritudo coccoides]